MTEKKTYSSLMEFETFEERLGYLMLYGNVGEDLENHTRWIMQNFYASKEWRNFRNYIIVRDDGCDLALPEYRIPNNQKIILHHIEPIDEQSVLHSEDVLLDPSNVICVTLDTHNAIHYGYENKNFKDPIIRRPNDTCPWK